MDADREGASPILSAAVPRPAVGLVPSAAPRPVAGLVPSAAPHPAAGLVPSATPHPAAGHVLCAVASPAEALVPGHVRRLFRSSRRAARQGVTLLEMTVAMALFMLILAATYSLFVTGRQQAEHPRASMAAQESLAQLVRWLERDLRETDIQSLRSYPNPGNSTEPPGLSLESARSPLDDPSPDRLVLGEYGVVRWQKTVYYTLVANAPGSRTGQLLRKEVTLAELGQTADTYRNPLGQAIFTPQSVSAPVSRTRVLATNVMMPNTAVTGVVTLGAAGGFYVYYDQGGPHAFDASTAHSEEVRVDLALEDVSSTTGKTTVLRHSLRIHPRN